MKQAIKKPIFLNGFRSFLLILRTDPEPFRQSSEHEQRESIRNIAVIGAGIMGQDAGRRRAGHSVTPDDTLMTPLIAAQEIIKNLTKASSAVRAPKRNAIQPSRQRLRHSRG